MVKKSSCIWYTCGFAYFTAYICGATLCWVFSKGLFPQSNPALAGAAVVSADIVLSAAKRVVTLIIRHSKAVSVVNVLARGFAGFLNLNGAALIAASMIVDPNLQEIYGNVVLAVGVPAVIFATLAAVLKFIFTIVDYRVKKLNEKDAEDDEKNKHSTMKMTSKNIDWGVKIFDALIKIIEQLINIA